MIDRFEIYRTNKLATTSDTGQTITNSIFGHPTAITFASQITENRYIDNPEEFLKNHEAGFMSKGGHKMIWKEDRGKKGKKEIRVEKRKDKD